MEASKTTDKYGTLGSLKSQVKNCSSTMPSFAMMKLTVREATFTQMILVLYTGSAKLSKTGRSFLFIYLVFKITYIHETRTINILIFSPISASNTGTIQTESLSNVFMPFFCHFIQIRRIGQLLHAMSNYSTCFSHCQRNFDECNTRHGDETANNFHLQYRQAFVKLKPKNCEQN